MTKRVLMLAAENGALKGAKVGGMADVIRDLPGALLTQNVCADVAMPGYGHLVAQTHAKLLATLSVPFAGGVTEVSLFRAPHPAHSECWLYLFEHPSWDDPEQKIYTDGGDQPFAADASRFALFCAASAEALLQQVIPLPDMLHLHDWHTGFFAMLRSCQRRYAPLQHIPAVYSIHNLALQGIRPISGDSSSLAGWYPDLLNELSSEQYQQICDPRYPHCVNPMRAGIVLSDRVHLVSPTYAKEVLLASRPEQGFFGGEGLEADLQAKARKRSLFGILNGCEYPGKDAQLDACFVAFLRLADSVLIGWQGNKVHTPSQDFIASRRISAMQLQNLQPDFLLTSVGRLTDQKMLLLRQPMPQGGLLIDAVLSRLAMHSASARLVLLGSGDPHLAEVFRKVAARHENLLFLNGYDEELSAWLYQHGQLFLMPSSFEPCGISQMLAMRAGQPCLVHGVGGLQDTVEHAKSGFVFGGDDLAEQAADLLVKLDEALRLYGTSGWQKIAKAAKAKRFSWAKSAAQYTKKLYKFS